MIKASNRVRCGLKEPGSCRAKSDEQKGDSVAEFVEVADGLIAAVAVGDVSGEPVGAEVVIVDVVGEDVPGGDEDAVADSHGGFPLADAA